MGDDECNTDADCDDGVPDCSDGFDNDGDGWIDYLEDPGCNNDPTTDNEINGNTGFECSNNLDDDTDGFIDGNDFGCESHSDGDESNCGDGHYRKHYCYK